MRLHHWFGLVLVCALGLIALAQRPAARDPGSPPRVPRLEPAKLQADQLALILGIDAWTFHYSGGRIRCWLEIEENGVKRKEPPDGVQDSNKGNEKAKEGKILFWRRLGELAPKTQTGVLTVQDLGPWWRGGELGLKTQTGISTGGYVKALGPTELWQRWKSWSDRIEQPLDPASTPARTPKPGEEITLLRAVMKETPDTYGFSRTITITLKGQFPREQE